MVLILGHFFSVLVFYAGPNTGTPLSRTLEAAQNGGPIFPLVMESYLE
jgi:hypothetical protein